MSNTPVIANWGSFPADYAPADWNDLLQQIAKVFSAYVVGDYTTFNWGNSVPAAEDQNKPWVRTNVDGAPDGLYTFFNGVWCRKHPVDASSQFRYMWIGDASNVTSLDGGDGSSDEPTEFTGAMWAIDTTFQDRIPMGVLATTGIVQSPLATAGSAAPSVSITVNNIPRHRHEITIEDIGETEATGDLYDADSTGHLAIDASDGAADSNWSSGIDKNKVGYTRYYGKAVPDAITLPLPPVIGVHVLKRTARKYYTV